MTWEQFYYAMMRSFLELGLITSRVYEAGSIKRRYYSRKMILASAYIRIIKDYIPCEKDENENGVHHLTSDEMRKVTNNLNGLFGTQYFFNFDDACPVIPDTISFTLDVGYLDPGITEIVGSGIIVDWGDGSPLESYPTGISTSITTTWDADTYTTVITYDTMTVFRALSESGIRTVDISKATELTILDLGSTNLASLDISSNTKLTSIDAWWIESTTFDISNNPLLTYVDLNNSSFSQTTVDSILVNLDTFGLSNGTVNLSGTSVPSATGLTAKTNLQGKGWTVTTD